MTAAGILPPRPGPRQPGIVISIRSYREADAAGVGRLIARTYSSFNLGFAPPEQRDGLLGPFLFAESAEPVRRAAIAQAIGAPVVLVAEEDGALVGVLPGRPGGP